MFNFKHLDKKRIILVVVLILAITTFVFAPLLVKAQGEGEDSEQEPPNKVAIKVVSWIVFPIVNLIGNLTTLVIRILTTVAQYNDFINSPAVSKGWIIIRDIFNMFFILVLLVIAFSTVLKIERYSYKKLLGGFLLAAVLVNFSKLICGFIIDISQILMLTFVNAFKTVGEGNFTEMLGLTDIVRWSENTTEITTAGAIGSLFLGLIMTIIALVVVTVITIILVFRIVYLWFLVLLSPAAFVANVLPNLKRYSSRWWQKFGSQVVIGPVLAFFLWLSLAVVQDTNDIGLYNTVVNSESKEKIEEDTLSIGSTESGKPQNVLSFAIGIAMLMGSLLIAQEMGVAGGKIAGNVSGKITSMAKGASKLPFKGAKSLGRATWKGTGLEARTISAKEGLSEGRFGKVGKFIYRRTKDGKKETDSERLYKARLMDHGVKGEELKSRMFNYKADVEKKRLDDQGQFQTTKDKKNKLEDLKKKGKLYNPEGLALAKSLAEENKLDEEQYKGFGTNMGEYIENDLRKRVKPKSVLLGVSGQKTKKDLTEKLQERLSTMKPTERVGLINSLDTGIEYDEENNDYKAKSERSIQGLQAFSQEQFSSLSSETKKKFLEKMGTAVGNGENNEGGVYNLTPEEFKGFKKQYKEYKDLAKKEHKNIEIKSPEELKEENLSDDDKSKAKTSEKIKKEVFKEIQKDPKTNNKIEELLENVVYFLRKGDRQKAKEETEEIRRTINPSLEKVGNEGKIKDTKGNPIDENKTREIIDKEFNKVYKDINEGKVPNFIFIKKEETSSKESVKEGPYIKKEDSDKKLSNLFKSWKKIKERKIPKEKGSLKSGKDFNKEERDAIREKIEKFKENYLNKKNYSDEVRDEIREISTGAAILNSTLKKGTITKKFFDKSFKLLDERIRELKKKISLKEEPDENKEEGRESEEK